LGESGGREPREAPPFVRKNGENGRRIRRCAKIAFSHTEKQLRTASFKCVQKKVVNKGGIFWKFRLFSKTGGVVVVDEENFQNERKVSRCQFPFARKYRKDGWILRVEGILLKGYREIAPGKLRRESAGWGGRRVCQDGGKVGGFCRMWMGEGLLQYSLYHGLSLPM
jgi:hypothetical protein